MLRSKGSVVWFFTLHTGTLQSPTPCISCACTRLGHMLSAAVAVLLLLLLLLSFARRPHPPPGNAWALLTAKAWASHVYYVKRTARCRRGRSPCSQSSGGSSRCSLVGASFSGRADPFKAGRLRGWSSFG